MAPRKPDKGSIRYFVGLDEIAGVLGGIACGLRQLGRKADLVLSTPHAFAYSATMGTLPALFEWLHALRTRNAALFILLYPVKILLTAFTFAVAVFRYDVFVFTGFKSFFAFYELPLLRMLGKKTVVIFLGSDSRPPYLSGICLDTKEGHLAPATAHRAAVRMRKTIRRIESNATLVVQSTSTAQFMSKPFVRLLQIGLPIDTQRLQGLAADVSMPERVASGPGVVRIVHAPSRPRAKGSEEIRTAVDELNAELAPAVELRLVELRGVTNAEVIREIARSDFVVNEVYSDTFMSVLDAEAAALGKPSVKFGYYANDLRADNRGVPLPQELLYFHPDELKNVVRAFALDADMRRRCGAVIREFVHEHWNSKAVAARLESALIEPGAGARVDPARLGYIYGAGLSLKTWRENVASYVDFAGLPELGLPPSLTAAIATELARNNPVPQSAQVEARDDKRSVACHIA